MVSGVASEVCANWADRSQVWINFYQAQLWEYKCSAKSTVVNARPRADAEAAVCCLRVCMRVFSAHPFRSARALKEQVIICIGFTVVGLILLE
jgi:hypothetical protein